MSESNTEGIETRASDPNEPKHPALQKGRRRASGADTPSGPATDRTGTAAREEVKENIEKAREAGATSPQG